MSMVTVGKNGRVYQRAFDHDEAKGLRAVGCTLAEIAAVYGVTDSAIWQAVNEDAKARVRAYNLQWHRQGTCPDCGAPSTRRRGDKSNSARCRDCARVHAATTVRPGSLRCSTCKTWKPDEAFPFNRTKRALIRRGRHASCRECLTILRREYRERNKIPCSTCGTPVLHERRDETKPPVCHSCSCRRVAHERLLASQGRTS